MIVVTQSTTTARRARLGVSLLFLTNGVLFSTFLPRWPEIKEIYQLSATAFGFIVAAFPLGSIVAAAFPAPIIRRFGARRTAAASSVLLAVFILIAGLSPTVWLLVAALFAGGFCDAVTDSAQNVQGVRVQRYMGRSIINSLHATWSAGALAGGLIGSWFAALAIPLGVHLAITGAVSAAIAIWAAHLSYVPTAPVVTEDAPTGRLGRLALLALIPLFVLSICGTLLEDVANNWAALYLRDTFGLPLGMAGLGFVVFVAGQFIGRFAGDPLTDRFGRVAVARAGGLIIAVGMASAALAPMAIVAMAGFVLAGFGCATLVPAAFAASADIPGMKEGTGIALLGWLMRLGFLLTSPAIGMIVDASSLRVGLIVPLVAGLLAALLATSLNPRKGIRHDSAAV